MRLALTPDQEALQSQLRAYFAHLSADIAAEVTDQPAYTRSIRRMGDDGWLGIGWPTEYGGQARGPVDQMIFVEESHWAGVPLPLLTLNSVGPTLMALGTAYRLLMEIVGQRAYLEEGSPGSVLASCLERSFRAQTIFTFGGGTNEIQRDLIAMIGLGMPRAPR